MHGILPSPTREPPKRPVGGTALPALSSARAYRADSVGAGFIKPWRRPRTVAPVGEFPPVAAFPLPPPSSAASGRTATASSVINGASGDDFPPPLRGVESSPVAAPSMTPISPRSVVDFSAFSAAGSEQGGPLDYGSVSWQILKTPELGKSACTMVSSLTAMPPPMPLILPVSELPPCMPVVSSSTRTDTDSMHSFVRYRQSADFDAHLLEASSQSPHKLHLTDLVRSGKLRAEFQRFQLTDYFDSRGAPRFKRMGLTFAATQTPALRSAFGSRIEEDPLRNKSKVFNPRSHANAHAALLNDFTFAEQQRRKILDQILEEDKLKGEDVRQRQLHLLFIEIPEFQKYLPLSVDLNDLEPAHLDKMDEIREKQTSERTNSRFADPRWLEGRRMGWMMNREEVLYMVHIAGLWTKAAWNSNCRHGMDRPSFCRFILDTGLVDQNHVPFHWAVSLFDSVAQPAQCCPPDALWASSAPITQVVNNWSLVSIFDSLLRQFFDPMTKRDFFRRLHTIAEKRLPQHLHCYLRDGAMDFAPPAAAGGPKGKSKPAKQHSHDSRRESNEHKSTRLDGIPGRPPVVHPPERPMSAVDTAFEMQVRDRLVSCMLVEPEVVHIAIQYCPLFHKIHRCYADDSGHMKFDMLYKFCVDFHLLPNLVSTDYLHTLYSKAQSLEEKVEAPPDPAPEPETKKNLLQQLVRSGSPATSIAGITEVLVAGNRLHAMQDKTNLKPSLKKESIVGKPQGQRKFSGVSGLRRIDRSGSPATPQVDNDDSGGHRKERQDQSPMKRYIFNVDAFLEVLLKIAFIRLGVYGNSAQRSTGGFARAVWLLTFLRCVFCHIYDCWQKHGQDSKDLWSGYRQLHKVLKSVRPDAWDNPHPTNMTVPLKEAVVQPMPGIGVKFKKRTTAGRSDSQLSRPPRGSTKKSHHHGSLAETVLARPTLTPRRTSRRPVGLPDVSEESEGTEMNKPSEGLATQPPFANGEDSPKSRKSQKSILSTTSLVESEVHRDSTATSDPGAVATDSLPLTSFASRSSASSSGSSSSSDDEEAVHDPDMPTAALEIINPVEKGRKTSQMVVTNPELLASMTHKHTTKEYWSLEDLFEIEGGKPCIANGRCAICERALRDQHWGNPRCRGCSIVDAVDFKYHPFRRLLLDHAAQRGGSSRLVKHEARLPNLEPHEMIPPPIGDLHEHLRAHFGPPQCEAHGLD